MIEAEVAVAKGALEGVEFALQGVETGALSAVCQLGAGGVDGLGQGLARELLPQGLHQRPHEVVDGGAVLLAVGILDAKSLEQALYRGGEPLFLHGGLGLGRWRAVPKQLAAELEGEGGEGKQGADGDHDVTLRTTDVMTEQGTGQFGENLVLEWQRTDPAVNLVFARQRAGECERGRRQTLAARGLAVCRPACRIRAP